VRNSGPAEASISSATSPFGALHHLKSLAFQEIGKALSLERIILDYEGDEVRHHCLRKRKQIPEFAMVALSKFERQLC
jgi:hypothetical protein